MQNQVAYSNFFELSNEAGRKYGTVFNLPVLKQPYEMIKDIYYREYPKGDVLDFGSGADKTLQKVLHLPNSRYYTIDDDPDVGASFARIEDIPSDRKFDFIAANQVFEHLEFQQGILAAYQLAQRLRSKGAFFISVPNPQHATRFLANPTHKTPWNYMNLHALLQLAGLDIILCARCNKIAGPRWYERPLAAVITRLYRIDWCDTIYILGKSP